VYALGMGWSRFCAITKVLEVEVSGCIAATLPPVETGAAAGATPLTTVSADTRAYSASLVVPPRRERLGFITFLLLHYHHPLFSTCAKFNQHAGPAGRCRYHRSRKKGLYTMPYFLSLRFQIPNPTVLFPSSGARPYSRHSGPSSSTLHYLTLSLPRGHHHFLAPCVSRCASSHPSCALLIFFFSFISALHLPCLCFRLDSSHPTTPITSPARTLSLPYNFSHYTASIFSHSHSSHLASRSYSIFFFCSSYHPFWLVLVLFYYSITHARTVHLSASTYTNTCAELLLFTELVISVLSSPRLTFVISSCSSQICSHIIIAHQWEYL